MVMWEYRGSTPGAGRSTFRRHDQSVVLNKIHHASASENGAPEILRWDAKELPTVGRTLTRTLVERMKHRVQFIEIGTVGDSLIINREMSQAAACLEEFRRAWRYLSVPVDRRLFICNLEAVRQFDSEEG